MGDKITLEKIWRMLRDERYSIPFFAWEQENVEMLFREIQSGESRLYIKKNTLCSEVWVATAFVYHYDGQAWFILQSPQRRYNTSLSGKYRHLSSAFEKKETAEKGLRRELKEELGTTHEPIEIINLGNKTNSAKTGKYPGIQRVIHSTSFAVLIEPQDYVPEGYRNIREGYHDEKFKWQPCNTPTFFKNQFS